MTLVGVEGDRNGLSFVPGVNYARTSRTNDSPLLLGDASHKGVLQIPMYPLDSSGWPDTVQAEGIVALAHKPPIGGHARFVAQLAAEINCTVGPVGLQGRTGIGKMHYRFAQLLREALL